MTEIRYLLDRDVMSQLDQAEAKRHENVRTWLKTIPDNALHVSAITIMEAWRGYASARKKAQSQRELDSCNDYEKAFDTLIAAFDGRVAPVDERVAKLWGQLRGQSDKNMWDLGVAATAITHEMVVATRNMSDFKGRGARIVDPFHKTPTIIKP